MSLSSCLAIVADISAEDTERLLEEVEARVDAGMTAADAQQTAVQDLLAEVEAEVAEAKAAVREQHADLFIEPEKPFESQYFGDVQAARSEPAMSRSAGLPDQLRGLAKKAAAPGNANETVVVAPVSKAEIEILRQAGIPVRDDAKHTVDLFAVRHALNRHADASQEAARGQLAITADDVAALPEIIAHADALALGAKTRVGLPAVGRIKRMPDGTVLYLEESRSGRNTLAMTSMRKYPGAKDFEAIARSLPSNARGDAGNVRIVPIQQEPELSRSSGRFVLPKFNMVAQSIERLQDRYNRWKQTVDAIREQGGVVTEANDFYRAEERYYGKVASRIEDFDRDVRAFLKGLAEDGVDLRSMQLYAYAKHAKERNAYLRTKREAGAGGFDSWSGMSDEDADAIIDDARQAGLEQVFEKHHAELMRWTQGTRDLLLDEGLITDDDYLLLNSSYDNYVPLRGNPDAEERRGTGKGFNVRGKETQRARGRYSEAENIIEHIIADRVKSLTRAGKNEVLRSFLQFVIDNPDPALWEINAVQRNPVMTTDDNGDQVIVEEPQVVKGGRTIGIKDGGREVFVLVRDAKLREQMQNLHIEQVGAILGHMLAAQRMLGRLYTSLNPVFTVLNFARDVQNTSMAMIDDVGFKGAAKLWAGLPGAMKESFKAEFGTPSAEHQLFRATGGKTGFIEFRQIDEISKDLEKRLVDFDRSGVNPLWWGPKALEVIEKINGGIENATRFSAFQAARSSGKTVAQASSIAKNTTNFNRKGTWTPALSAFFLFFNPAVQGTARVAQALKSPKVLATLGAGMTGVAMLALQNASMGDDDDGTAWWDKIPQEVKDRNLIIILPPGSKAG